MGWQKVLSREKFCFHLLGSCQETPKMNLWRIHSDLVFAICRAILTWLFITNLNLLHLINNSKITFQLSEYFWKLFPLKR